MKNQTAEIISLLESYASWAILCHENPDGDTLGCALSLYLLARRLGKKAIVGGKNSLPSKYQFLPHSSDYKIISASDIPDDALVICIDTSTRARSVDGIEKIVECHESVNIDHHADNELYCKRNLVCATASATAEIVTDLIAQKWRLTKDEATCLYVALVTDNGNFRFSSVTPDSLKTAAVLIEAGANQAEIDDCLNENMTEYSLKLWGYGLESMKIFANGTSAICSLSCNDFLKFKSLPSDMENFVNQMLRVKGVKIALFVTEYEGKIKLSVRTRNPFSARDIAHKFGGGGHVNAAGASLNGEFQAVVKDVVNKVQEYAVTL